ncbi:hypothetical protein CKF58_00735 [Psittacicella hinzii]|uniref:Uncharacterized protein n=1 Tax=Psittacicella hinzii TaxID=2028575 RepID=A0A3A1YV44_9GAMM|nr:hypothetical protein CKF58_00735 [Psittacicella hinzii]
MPYISNKIYKNIKVFIIRTKGYKNSPKKGIFKANFRVFFIYFACQEVFVTFFRLAKRKKFRYLLKGERKNLDVGDIAGTDQGLLK